MLMPIALALLAPSAMSGPRLAVRPGKPDFDPTEVICKHEPDPTSRLARRTVCRTAAEWAEERRQEQHNLQRHQYNGAQ